MIKFKRLTIALAALLITSATAWAADDELLTTINASSDFTSGSKTFDDKATVTFEDGGNFTYVNNGWIYNGASPYSLTVTPAEGYTVTRVKFSTDHGNLEDTSAPFKALLCVDGMQPKVQIELGGTAIEGGVKKIEVYGHADAPAGTPVEGFNWDGTNKTGTFTMPAANVTLNVEYEPELTATFKALTANTIEAGKATVSVTENGQPVTTATLADGKLTPVYEGQTITLTAQTGYKFRTVTATKGAAAAGPLATPLTMECLSDGTIKVDMSGTLSTGMQYAVNGGEKTTITTTTTIEGLTTGDKVQFYGVGISTQVYGNVPEVKISGGTATVKVYGNIMSLLDEENFATKTDLPSYVFYGLFRENAKLTDASGLLLPATTLAFSCYAYMFRDCSALTAAPELPATTLADYCYSNMFYKCSKLASVTCKATNISATDCLDSWLYNAGRDATSPKLYVDPSMTSNTGWQNAGFTVTAIPGN